jgi:glycosyltransferase involved in cell wall biosynthesis
VISLSLLEAMACGRSVVVTDVGGMREALGDDGECGAIVPLDDPGALADAIAVRLADPARATAEGRAARARVEAFGLEPWGAEIAGVTQEALAVGPRR